MIKNVNLFLYWACVVVACAFNAEVKADVGMPPVKVESGYAGTPVEQKLRDLGYNSKTNTLNYDGSKGTTTTKTNATFTDNYGNKATGTVTGRSPAPKTGPFAKGVAGWAAAKAAGAAVNSDAAKKAAEAAARGDKSDAYAKAAEAAAQGAASLDPFGLGGGLYGLWDAYENEKARQGFDKEQQKKIDDYPYPTAPNKKDFPIGVQLEVIDGTVFPWGTTSYKYGSSPENGVNFIMHSPSGEFVFWAPVGHIEWVLVTEANQADLMRRSMGQADVKAEDIMNNAKDFADFFEDAITKILNNQQANHFDLMRAMYGMGLFGQGGMFEGQDGGTSGIKILGSTQDNTFRTAPFTPAGSNQAQQTQFQVNQDGSVTISQVKRPDLSANTDQAPTRSEVGKTTTNPTRPGESTATAEAPDICAKNPNSIMCSELGDTSYEDPVLPEKEVNLNFNPSSVFSSTGTCPQPVTIDVFGPQFIEYQPICNAAERFRPFVIFSGMFLSMMLILNITRE